MIDIVRYADSTQYKVKISSHTYTFKHLYDRVEVYRNDKILMQHTFDEIKGLLTTGQFVKSEDFVIAMTFIFMKAINNGAIKE